MLSKVTKNEFDSIYSIMTDSFPVTEMRTYEGQLKLFDKNKYEMFVKKDESGTILAFIGSWEFKGFRFIEHFAVDNKLRGQGMGSKILAEYISMSQKPVVLEVEPAETPIAKSRIEFYERLGFHLNKFYYEQLPLYTGGKNMELKIMTYPSSIDINMFEEYKKVLYENVYGFKYNL